MKGTICTLLLICTAALGQQPTNPAEDVHCGYGTVEKDAYGCWGTKPELDKKQADDKPAVWGGAVGHTCGDHTCTDQDGFDSTPKRIPDHAYDGYELFKLDTPPPTPKDKDKWFINSMAIGPELCAWVLRKDGYAHSMIQGVEYVQTCRKGKLGILRPYHKPKPKPKPKAEVWTYIGDFDPLPVIASGDQLETQPLVIKPFPDKSALMGVGDTTNAAALADAYATLCKVDNTVPCTPPVTKKAKP